jgi:polyhydroxyalkanoate synthesis regulator phasin
MSIQPPRIEARVSAQERLQTILHARIEELSEDMLSSFGAQAVYQGRIEQKIDALQEDMSAVKKDMSAMATKEDVATFKGDITALENRMQGSIDALEKRVLDAFQQLLTMIDQRLPPQKK